MPEKERAAPTANRKATQEQKTSIEIVPERARVRKQAWGRCPCGAEIGANVTTLRCSTCSAWLRWRSAFRIASHNSGEGRES